MMNGLILKHRVDWRCGSMSGWRFGVTVIIRFGRGDEIFQLPVLPLHPVVRPDEDVKLKQEGCMRCF
jgi:hypothetical protein